MLMFMAQKANFFQLCSTLAYFLAVLGPLDDLNRIRVDFLPKKQIRLLRLQNREGVLEVYIFVVELNGDAIRVLNIFELQVLHQRSLNLIPSENNRVVHFVHISDEFGIQLDVTIKLITRVRDLELVLEP